MRFKLKIILFMSIAVIYCLLAFVAGSYAASITYTYDELNRLIRGEYADGTIIDYYYDEVGNRTSRQQLETTPPATSASPAGGYYNASQSVNLT
jgi:YD repeat-containing protein